MTAAVTEITGLEELEFAPDIPCEYSGHRRLGDGPAVYVIVAYSVCGCGAETSRFPICRGCYERTSDILICSECRSMVLKSDSWKIVLVLRKDLVP